MDEAEGVAVDFVGGAPVAGRLEVRWNHGTRGKGAAPEPKIQIHRYDEHTVILRQSKVTSYEAPFMFLLFGNERALLLDTGAVADPELFPLRATVDGLVGEWLARHPRDGYELVVAHTHGHGDHVAADAQFADRPHTTVVARELDAVLAHFGFGEAWPAETVPYDLGGRVLQVIGAPGHHKAGITYYDPWTAILFTGDTVLPGRLYVEDAAAFRATMQRLVAFAEGRTVSHVFGCHVEMKDRPRRDYPLGATYQPRERAPQMTVAQLRAIRDAAESVGDRKGVRKYDDFILYNEPGRLDLLKLMARGLAGKYGLTRR